MKNKKFLSNTHESVSVIAPARLHLGFMDMHGGMGRYFGSLGLCLAEISTHLTACRSEEIRAEGQSSQRVLKYIKKIVTHFNIESGIAITIHEAIPEHAGLGSGTQLSLAVATVITQLFDIATSTREIANVLERGSRSGIGVGTFFMGGFLVDGGRGKHTDIPPIVSHIPFPSEWRVVLIFDKNTQGMNGLAERKAFTQLPAMNEQVSASICRIVLMQTLPALIEEDCEQFGAAIQTIQEMVGDYFQDVQGGRYSSVTVSKILPWFSEHGSAGCGQSSWGPTGFALFADEAQASQRMREAHEIWQDEGDISFMLCRARNRKADIIFNAGDDSGHLSINSNS